MRVVSKALVAGESLGWGRFGVGFGCGGPWGGWGGCAMCVVCVRKRTPPPLYTSTHPTDWTSFIHIHTPPPTPLQPCCWALPRPKTCGGSPPPPPRVRMNEWMVD